MWLDWLLLCDCGFSLPALWCPLPAPTVLLWFLWPWTWVSLLSDTPVPRSHCSPLQPCNALSVCRIGGDVHSLILDICNLCLFFLGYFILFFFFCNEIAFGFTEFSLTFSGFHSFLLLSFLPYSYYEFKYSFSSFLCRNSDHWLCFHSIKTIF